MTHLLHFCQSCDWQGETPEVFDEAGRVEAALSLEPGQAMPSGSCPKCEGHVLPSTVHSTLIAPQPSRAGRMPAHAMAWGLSFHRIGPSYIAYVQHPLGHGCEIMIEVVGERPQVSVTPYQRSDELGEEDPLALIRAGKDEITVWNGQSGYGRPLRLAADGISAGALMSANDWHEHLGWAQSLSECQP